MAKIMLEGYVELYAAIEKKMDLKAVKQIVQFNGDKMNERMKENTRTAFKKGYANGDTAESINTVLSENRLTATVEPTTYYSPYVEYGTRYMKKEPFV